ncbi:MAG: histidine kinase [Chthoniobacterales bacterium]|nr:histidine kinase [Chthoniobacterales bacterium]
MKPNPSLFWKCQIGGWLVFIILSFPNKIALFGSVPAAFISLYRDALGFLWTWGMYEIYRRISYRQTGVARVIALVTILSLLGGVILAVVSRALRNVFPFEEAGFPNYGIATGVFYYRAVLFACWSFLYFGLRLVYESMEKDVSLARAEAARSDAELQMLRAQMNPHFLYNALNTIISEIGKPGQHLKELVRALSEYLRYSLENRHNDRVPLGNEFDAMRGYLAVEKARFRENLEIECRIDETARSDLAPGIFMQPLVENAVKYGKKTSSRPLRVRLDVSHPAPDRIRVEVANTGHWLDTTGPRTTGGVGLGNLRQRLELLYPGTHDLRIIEENGWVTVRVEIPA